MFRIIRKSTIVRNIVKGSYVPSVTSSNGFIAPISFNSFRLNHSENTASIVSQGNGKNSPKTVRYAYRHIGPQPHEQEVMLNTVGAKSLQDLIDKIVPSDIRISKRLDLPDPIDDQDALSQLKGYMSKNKLYRSFIGMGYYDTITPPVLLRTMLENPSWYTPYTPYQAEISQGRLEMLLNFQTMVTDLVGKSLSNASLLDEATACAESMNMAFNLCEKKRQTFLVSESCHPQNIAVVQTRAEPLGVNVKVVPDDQLLNELNDDIFGVLVQYPSTYGDVNDYSLLANKIHEKEGVIIAATDLLACTLIKPPGEWGADIVVGTSQRFGVPLGYGGPHAGYLATEEKYMRKMPGRIIGVTKDSRGKSAYRMSLQTREQHIRREKATSNICTAQALLANISAAYSLYHGPNGLKKIAQRVNYYTYIVSNELEKLGHTIVNKDKFFDTITVKTSGPTKNYIESGWNKGINLRPVDNEHLTISLDETTNLNDLNNLLEIFSKNKDKKPQIDINKDYSKEKCNSIPSQLKRTTEYLTHERFNSYHSETAMMRYLYSLERKDIGLNTAMIPLGSCTMKLNAAAAMTPVTWKEVNSVHPFAPKSQAEGYSKLINDMEYWLKEITGFDAVSLQPNSGAQGEYTGLMVIRQYFIAKNQTHRNICLIPTSAHGTNPASAALVSWKIVPVSCDESGNVDVDDLKKKAEKYRDNLACCMITYPSTHGVFEEAIREICNIIHDNGGLVYMDGANLQAQVGFCSPGDIGADVCHVNLHKTFCIPHGGGGPGLGPIGVKKHLTPYLPTHPVIPCGKDENNAIGPVTGGPYSSASILPIPWMYIRMMGPDGLATATAISILNANYMAKKLEKYYDILYRDKNGYCAHEFIIDMRGFKKACGVTAEDVAKRLMDFGFHAPTMSFPVPDTLMVEPTESEPLSELDRLIEAMIHIRKEIEDVEQGKLKIEESPLRGAPHTHDTVINDDWNRKYTRKQAAYPLPYLQGKTYWPTVGRVDNVYGDKNPVCTCPPVEAFAEE